MVRTTPEEVAGIIEVDASIPLTPFIMVASAMVDYHCGAAGLTEGNLLLVETWLAAHFYALRDRRVKSESAGPVSETKDDIKIDLALNQTVYGQTAMMLDTSGSLSAWNDAIVDGNAGGVGKGIVWLGTSPGDLYVNY